MKKRILKIALCLACALAVSACGFGKNNDNRTDNTDTEQTAKKVSGTAKKFGKLKNFTAKTLDGKNFGPDDLAECDLTIINFWSTWCGPCVEEMPELAEFAAKLPENIRFVTVCFDGEQVPDEAKKILDKAGFDGITITNGDEDFATVCDRIQYTPTTLIVDSQGNMMGDEMVGTQENTLQAYLDYVNDVLKRMEKEEISFEK